MPKPTRWVDVDDYMNYRPPNTDRSTWTKSNEWAFGIGTDFPKKEGDPAKCPTCLGLGRIWVQKEGNKNERRRKKTSIECPDQCEYTKRY